MQIMRSVLAMILLLIPGFIGSCSYVPTEASDSARSALDFTVALAENRKTELLRLTTDSGKVVANAWRTLIGYSNFGNPLNTLTATPQDIWLAAQEIYANYPALLEAVRQQLIDG